MSSAQTKKQKPLKWVTYDSGMENTSELRAAAEAVPSRPNVRFLSHEGPNEKNEDFRRTVRMHVMRDYRQRMRELAASGNAPPSTTKRTTSGSPKRLAVKAAVESRRRNRSTLSPSPSLTAEVPKTPTNNVAIKRMYGAESQDGYGSEDSEEFWQSTNTSTSEDVSLQNYLSLLNCNYGFTASGPPSPSSFLDPESPEAYAPSYDDLPSGVMGVLDAITPYNNDRNPIMRRIVPVAYSRMSTLYAFLALSEVHSAAGRNEQKVRSLCYRVSAISGLNKDIESASATHLAPDERRWILDNAIATAFLIGTYDYIDTGVTGWDMRMAGCTHLVNMVGGPTVLGFDGLLQQLFAWYDVFGSSLTFSRPALSTEYWMPTQDRLDRGLWPMSQLFGAPDRIMAMIAEMSVLANTLRNSPDADISEAAANIEDRLHTWSPATQMRPHYGDGWEQNWEAFRLAALIYVYTILYHHDSTDFVVQRYAVRLLNLLEHHINPDLFKNLLWVVFIAGSAAETRKDRYLVQHLTDRGWKSSQIGAWRSARNVLEGMWASGANLWEVVLDAEKRGVAYLFY